MAEADKACCTKSPVTSNYSPRGHYGKLAGLDVYITGNESSSRGVIDVYDIFGMANATLQGADLLAKSLDALVLVPDLFKGEPMKIEWYPPDTEEKKALVQKFRVEKLSSLERFDNLIQVTKEAKENWSGIEAWGIFGLCWGGKQAALASGPGTLFKVSGTAHPGMLDKTDAEKMTIPHICLFSKEDGTPELVKEYTEVLKARGDKVEMYGSMHHGWMGARANLEDADNLKEYERGYNQVTDFFKAHL